jgi:hypothetical protein
LEASFVATDDNDKTLGKPLHWTAWLLPEQKAAWRKKVSEGVSRGMREFHATRTPEQRERLRQKSTDAAICRTFTPHRPGTGFQKGHGKMGTSPLSLARRELTKVQKASIRRIIKDLVEVQPEMWIEAIIRGVQSEPPRSFPYLMMAAQYLDGKPTTEPPPDPIADLSALTREELAQRAAALVARLRETEERAAGSLPVIDVQPVEDTK